MHRIPTMEYLVTSAITLQRCANGVICLPTTAGVPPDLAQAYIFGDVTDASAPGTAALLAFINGALGKAPTLPEVRTELQATSADLSPAEPEAPAP